MRAALNVDGGFTVEVTQVGEDRVMGKLVRLLDELLFGSLPDRAVGGSGFGLLCAGNCGRGFVHLYLFPDLAGWLGAWHVQHPVRGAHCLPDAPLGLRPRSPS